MCDVRLAVEIVEVIVTHSDLRNRGDLCKRTVGGSNEKKGRIETDAHCPIVTQVVI
jgi:hypothetical protein